MTFGMVCPRFRATHVFGFLFFGSITLFFFSLDKSPLRSSLSSSTSSSFSSSTFSSSLSSKSSKHKGKASKSTSQSALDYCPYSNHRKHIPTVILLSNGLTDRKLNRTCHVEKNSKEPATFLPYAYPPRDLRFAQDFPRSPSREKSLGIGGVGIGQGGFLDELIQPGEEEDEEEHADVERQLCPVFSVPSSPSPEVPSSWQNSKIMFGMSTVPDRVLYNIPVWKHWLPTAAEGPIELETISPITRERLKELPMVLILTPTENPVTATRIKEAVDEALSKGILIEMKYREADRFETRYFALVEEMWNEAIKRENEEGVMTEWFVLADDDTFFPDFDSLIRLLSDYDSSQDVIVGGLTESTKQLAEWGHIAYGGAGIYVSRSLMERMNMPGIWSACLAKYGASFGGDAMVSACAALVLDSSIPELLKVEETLHQLDIRGDGTGWFQSGFLITSLHHWGSWFTLFPPWHETGAGDLRTGILTVGKASKAVGGDNWGRRYTFDGGKVIVHLGYSIVVEAKPLLETELEQSEHTWWEFETFHPTRPAQEESIEKRTYYITNVRYLDQLHGNRKKTSSSGKGDGRVVRLEHKNREGERIDVIWDRRSESRKSIGSWLWGL